MVYSQDIRLKLKISTNMLKTLLLGTATTTSSVVVEHYFSEWINPSLVTLTAMGAFALIVFKLLNEIHSYKNRNKKNDNNPT